MSIMPINLENNHTLNFSENEFKNVIKAHFCKDATDAELALAFMVCKQQNLNPLAGDVHLVKYAANQKLQIIVSKYAFLKRAERNKNYDGFKAWTEGSGSDLVAKCEVYRKDRARSIYAEVYIEEYDQKNNMWKDKPRTMLRKVAITQAHREAFPDELGGLYCEDEMPEFDKNQYPNGIEEQSKQERSFISDGQLTNFCIRQQELSLEDSLVKDMLKEKGFSPSGSRKEIYVDKFLTAKKEMEKLAKQGA